MNTQLALGLPAQEPSNCVVINARCMLRAEEDQRVILVGGLAVFHYSAADVIAEAYAMVMLVESGFAQQIEIAQAFSISERTVRRHQQRYAHAGMVGLGRPEGWRPGRRRVSSKRLRLIERLKSQGLSNRAIAQRLGVNEKVIRKLTGPSKSETVGQLALVTRVGTFKATSGRQIFPAYRQANLRAGMMYDSWMANLFVTNLADGRGVLAGGLDTVPTNSFIYTQPRTVGLAISRTL
jgi:DNA-binding CsgD family transcriptional regulator